MILLGSTLLNAAVMGLQTGSELARTDYPIIDPKDLAIIAYVVKGPLLDSHHDVLVRIADVRELSDIGLIVDSQDEFVQKNDVIKLQEICDLNFTLVGMSVIDERRHKLGKIVDYTIDTTTFTVQQLTVRRPLLKSLNDTELVIHRSQIIEINDDAIVVHSEAKAPEPDRNEAIGSYVNPFRKTGHAPETAQTFEDQ